MKKKITLTSIIGADLLSKIRNGAFWTEVGREHFQCKKLR